MKTKKFDINEAKVGMKVVVVNGPNYDGTIIHLNPVVVLIKGEERMFSDVFDDFGVTTDVYPGLSYSGRPHLELLVEPKLASDLSGLEVGDKVWDIIYGWGRVEHVGDKTIGVSYNCGTVHQKSLIYSKSGREVGISAISNQSLFTREIKFEIPEVE